MQMNKLENWLYKMKRNYFINAMNAIHLGRLHFFIPFVVRNGNEKNEKIEAKGNSKRTTEEF